MDMDTDSKKMMNVRGKRGLADIQLNQFLRVKDMGKNTMLVSAEWVRVMGRSRTSTFRNMA